MKQEFIKKLEGDEYQIIYLEDGAKYRIKEFRTKKSDLAREIAEMRKTLAKKKVLLKKLK